MLVTLDNLHTAIESQQPFLISMADGKEYKVPHRDFISFNGKRTTAIVSTEDGRIHFLPLLTMTGVSMAESADEAKT